MPLSAVHAAADRLMAHLEKPRSFYMKARAPAARASCARACLHRAAAASVLPLPARLPEHS